MSSAITVAGKLRSLSVQELTQLLTLRPDLANPAPRSLPDLAERATTAASTRAAVESLDAWQLRVLTAAVALGDVPRRNIVMACTPDTACPPTQADVDTTLDDLGNILLLLEDHDTVHVVGAAAGLLGPFPAGLAPRSTTVIDDVPGRLAAAGPAVIPVIERLAWSPTGRLPHANRPLSPQDATTPVELALAHHLLRPVDDHTVILPREVALHARRGRLFPDVVAPQPPAWPEAQDPDRVNTAAIGTALEAVSAMSALLEAVDHMHPARLRNGGMARRDGFKALSRVCRREDGWFHLWLAVSADLLGADARGWLPSQASDHWSESALWQRWLALHDAWLTMTGAPGQLSNSLDAPSPATAQTWRREIATQIASAPVGTPIDTEKVSERLAWFHPTWPVAEAHEVIDAVLHEASLLGVIALGCRSRLADDRSDPGMPEPGTDLILQSDLTVVAPGPLTPAMSRDLALLADRESTGVAGVRRFSRSSLRRGLDAGWTREQVRGWWAEHSMTEVPQGLLILLDDVVRDHGRVSVSAASCLIEVDDPASAEILLRSDQASELGLRRVAPTLLIAQAEPEVTLAALRAQGLAPVTRDQHGAVLNSPTPARFRTPAREPTSEPVDPQTVAEALVASTEPSANSTDEIASLLREAQSRGAWIRLDHVDDSGQARQSVVRVLAVASGAARCVHRGGGGMRIIPLPRMVRARLENA
ncbi:MAG: helicase-associated domain-containing protein [Cutibacterium granulosum]|uniref:helicase-associated domain-containing protein n=1 Tax=Cutibacterium granulosum TaxID=33011 RepID=UPI0029075494|nr:helicase-associated domain-containing protein [Cutibacterium granulosum]MDU3820715.1 helicase-associated domain-containing protein [Cutibacterium granulosum]